jgi:hypothetical protein
MSDVWKQALVDKICEMADGIHALIVAADKNDDRINDAERAIQKLFRAFPGSDVEGHCRYHQLIIENTEEKRRLRVAIQEKTISALIWSAIVGVAVLMFNGFLDFISR